MKIKCIDCGRLGTLREFKEFWGNPDRPYDLICPIIFCGGDGVVLQYAE